jgi:hypothetical protein
MRNQKRKAQLQIMENAFILLFIFIILIIAFVFVVAFQKSGRQEQRDEFKELELMKKAQILNFLPEIQCSRNNDISPDCIDILKMEAFKEKLESPAGQEYRALFGNVKITVMRLNVESGEWENYWIVYDNPKPNGIKAFPYPVLLFDPVADAKKNSFGIVYIEVYE